MKVWVYSGLLGLAASVLLVGCGKPETAAAPPSLPPPAPIAVTAPADAPPAGTDAPAAEAPAKPVRAKKLHALLEAEAHSKLVAPFVVADDPAASGGKFLNLELGVGKPPQVEGQIELRHTLAAASSAYLWLRVRWLGECSNSLNLRLGTDAQGTVYTLGENGTYNEWHWVKLKGPPLELPAGELVLTLIQREDGVAVDQVLLTADKDFVPMGIE